MTENSKHVYTARFDAQTYEKIAGEAESRATSMQRIIDDAIALYFREKGTPLWQKSISSGPNWE